MFLFLFMFLRICIPGMRLATQCIKLQSATPTSPTAPLLTQVPDDPAGKVLENGASALS